MSARAKFHLLFVFECISLTFVASVVGQEGGNTVTVSGRGQVKALPTSVELTGTMSVEAELAGDALTKFRSMKASSLAAVNKLEIKNLSVVAGNFTIGPTATGDFASQTLLRARGGVPDPPKVTIQESLRFRLVKIDKLDRDELMATMAQLMDMSKEWGVTFGPPPGVRILPTQENVGVVNFMIDDLRPLHEMAQAQALKDARERAEHLVMLSGRRLGAIRSIQETMSYLPSTLRGNPPGQSPKLDDIEISVTVQVQFNLLSAE